MSDELWRQVAEDVDRHEYMAGVERTVERVKATGEVFTPTALVIEMLQYLGLDEFAPGRTVLDPACGDGQFLVAAKSVKVRHFGMAGAAALTDIYGVDIMRDNVDLCRRRLGGGTVIMGDMLSPEREHEGQTVEEHELMLELFNEPMTRTRRRRSRVGGRKRRGSVGTGHEGLERDALDVLKNALQVPRALE